MLELGKIYDGKVTSIKEYGAFVEIIGEDATGMVHISQISNEYVTNAKDYLTENQEVKVKFIGTNEDGKIKLSIKEALPQENRKNNYQQRRNNNNNNNSGYKKNNNRNNSYQYKYNNNDDLFPKNNTNDNFEDMLSKFKQNSDENLNDLKKITDRRNRSRRK